MANRTKLAEWMGSWAQWRPGGASRARGPSAVTVLDIDGNLLRVVQSAGRGDIARVISVPLELPADADRNAPAVLGVAVAKALVRLKLRPGSVVMGVPRAKAVLRTLTVPAMDKVPELAALIHFQVGRDLPFRMEEAVVDFQVVRRFEAPAEPAGGVAADGAAPVAAMAAKMEVLVAAVKREVVEFYQAVARSAGCQLSALGLLPSANARCVAACGVEGGETSVVLVSLRPDEVGVDVLARNSLIFSRGAAIRNGPEPGAAPGATPASDSFLRSVVIEVVRSLHGHSGLESDAPVARILVAGATGYEGEVVAALAARLVTPGSVLDPVGALNLPVDASEHAAGAIGAMGLAMGCGDASGLPFDFLKPKQPAVQRDLRRLMWMGGASVAVLALVGVLALRSTLIQRRAAVLAAATAELADAEKKRPTYRRLIQQATVIEDWVKGGRDWLQQYAYLTSILPPSEEIYLTSMAISGQGTIRLAVQARSGEILARLDRQLRAAGYEVKPLAITPGADRFGYEFRSNVELVPSTKQTLDLQQVKPANRPSDDVSLDPAAYRGKGGGG